MSDSIFQPSPALQAASKALKQASGAALANVRKVLHVALEEYRRRVQRVSPVEKGLLRQSWQTKESIDGTELVYTLGTSLKSADNMPYPVYLELGTDRIAGGAVKAWQPGDAPIMDWPAKHKDLPNMTGKMSGAKYERAASISQMAFTGGQGEQMPFLRPIGAEIAQTVIAAIPKAIKDGFASAVGGKKFGS